jgi:hypothetical protein
VDRNGCVREYILDTNILSFEGRYLNDKRNGKGKEYSFFDGQLIYEGEYLEDKRNGKGIEYFENGKTLFEGEFYKGYKWTGKGYDLNGNLIAPERLDKIKHFYNIINIQKEDFNYIILQKYILYMIITILIHGFIFIYCPMIGNYHAYGNVYCPNKNEIDESDDEDLCNDFKFNKTLIIFYLVYIIYLVSSGLQIKYGFYDLKRKSLLKSGNKSINGYIYNIYKAIPFLYEIKLAIDWTFTKTCLDLFQWNKYESTYDIIFVTFCQMTAKNVQLVGRKVKVFFKIFMGGLLAFALIIILIIHFQTMT